MGFSEALLYQGQEIEMVGYEEGSNSKPTNHDSDYLKLRQQLKEAIRKKMRKNSCALPHQFQENEKLHHDNYGSFFGPSETVIARRVIEQSKALLEIQHSTSKSKTRAGVTITETIGLLELKMKAQRLRESRDYSFLFSTDPQLPTSTRKKPLPKKVSELNSAQLPSESKLSVSSSGRKVPNMLDDRNHVSTAHQAQPKVWPDDVSSTKRLSFTSTNPRKQLCRPAMQEGSLEKASKKIPVTSGLSGSMTKSQSATKGHSKPEEKYYEPRKGKSMTKQHVEEEKKFDEPDKAKAKQKHLQSYSKHKRKRLLQEDSDEEDGDVSAIIRRLFRYDPRKFKDDDDTVMESSFGDILKEERRSAIAARKEDEEERLLIEHEERRNEQLRIPKKRKLLRH